MVSTPGETCRGYAESTTRIQLRWPSRGMAPTNFARHAGRECDDVCAGDIAASRITAKRVLSIGSDQVSRSCFTESRTEAQWLPPHYSAIFARGSPRTPRLRAFALTQTNRKPLTAESA